ncbi:hypothetical protein Natpe_4017 (plasmid) [Natrinema pellirubrum DSM 15624]|uniref:Halobacterial output domain-containing protein n=1 Tax=Natrinema pellirubrum (strain DSM 15624 / CIP 106293 / JCM 10476 / NCIMB 786 / 157) TaxID=797303 RepID=L0JSX2_NATP1|nr:hypothetical protein [Natrinema pellirubrum]AGB33747.1 hypothetical protein Natpe_4017 [Natrinema pellirubrum DSM 15624]
MAWPESERSPNRLFLGPPPDNEETTFYLEQTSPGDQPLPSVFVSTRHSSTAVFERYRESIADDSPEIDVITVDEASHVPASHPREDEDYAGRLVSVGTRDLSGLEIAISDSLTRQEEESLNQLWFDSLTPLIRTLGLDDVFKFLHMMTNRVEQAGAIASYHLDPTAHEPQTVNTAALNH